MTGFSVSCATVTRPSRYMVSLEGVTARNAILSFVVLVVPRVNILPSPVMIVVLLKSSSQSLLTKTGVVTVIISTSVYSSINSWVRASCKVLLVFSLLIIWRMKSPLTSSKLPSTTFKLFKVIVPADMLLVTKMSPFGLARSMSILYCVSASELRLKNWYVNRLSLAVLNVNAPEVETSEYKMWL